MKIKMSADKEIEMDHYEKLDAILNALVSLKLNHKGVEQPATGFTMNSLCAGLKLNILESEQKLLENILISDGHIFYPHQVMRFVFNITESGVAFFANGGYANLLKENELLEHKRQLELALIKSSLQTNSWSRYGVLVASILSLLALTVSIIALLKK